MVTYIDAASAPLKNTGVIRLYTAEDFDAMRKACQLTARCLDELAAIVKPGVTTAGEVEKLLGKAGRRMSFPRQGIDSLEYEMRLYGETWIVSIAITPDGKVRDVQRRRLNVGF